MDVAVDEAAAGAGEIDPAVDAGVPLDDLAVAVLMSQIGNGDPGGALVIRTEEAVEPIDGAGDEDGWIVLSGGGHAHAHADWRW